MKNKPELSQNQDSAANPRVNVLVRANAGTGKTSVLVQRLLRILFRSDDVENCGILCLTYTNAGASEMHNRILGAMRDWALASDADLVELLRDVALNKPATAEDVAYARKMFFWFVDNQDKLKVKTIHSFCEEILRRFPIEAGIAPSWTLVTDENQRVLLHDAFDRLINTPNLDAKKYSRVAGAFDQILTQLSEYKLDDLLKILQEQCKYFFQVDDLERYRKYFVDTVRNFLQLDSAPREDIPVSELQKIADFAESKIKSPKDKRGYLEDIFNLTKQYIDKTIDFDKYKYAYLTKDRTPIANIKKKNDFMSDEQNRVYAIDQYHENQTLFDNTMALFDLAAGFTSIYTEIKQQRNLLDFEDLVLYTRKLFSNPETMGWVLSQMDTSLSHILIDEAQDTSPLHWDVIVMLLNDFFVSGDTGEMGRTLFIVGDPKQAIYGFQGADSHVFASSLDEIVRHVQNNLRTISEIPLTQSFRSLPSILYAVDSFFNDPVVAQQTGFHNNSHKFWRHESDGLVEIHDLVAGKPSGITVKGYISTIADKIESMVNSGKCKPSDIMVLVQRRKPLANLLVTELKKKNIEVAGSDRIILPAFPAIRDLMNLIRFCIDTTDDYSLCCVLKSPMFRLTESQIFDLCAVKNKYHAENPDAKPMTVFDVMHTTQPDLYNAIKDIVKMAMELGPYSFFSRLLNSGMRKEFISALGPQAIEPLDEFMTICLSYERTQPGTMREFLKWFITGSTEIKRNINAASGVRIATIHGSKGLEAPIIFLIDTVTTPSEERVCPIMPGVLPKNVTIEKSLSMPWIWAPRKSPSEKLAIAQDEAMNERYEEYYRLLYVAMTRARDELYIYGYTKDTNPVPKSWHCLLWNKFQSMPDTIKEENTIRIIHGM